MVHFTFYLYLVVRWCPCWDQLVMVFVCGWVCVYVSTIKRKPLIGMTCKLAQSSTLCRSLLILGSNGQGSGLGLWSRQRTASPGCYLLYTANQSCRTRVLDLDSSRTRVRFLEDLDWTWTRRPRTWTRTVRT